MEYFSVIVISETLHAIYIPSHYSFAAVRGLGVPQLGIHPILVAVMPVYDCRCYASVRIGIFFLTFVGSDAITEMLVIAHTEF